MWRYIVLFGLPTLLFAGIIIGLIFGYREEFENKAMIERGIIAEAEIVHYRKHYTKSNRHGDHGTLVGYTFEYKFIDEEGVVYHDDAYNISLENDPELYLGTKYKIYLGENGKSINVGHKLSFGYFITLISVFSGLYVVGISGLIIFLEWQFKKTNKEVEEIQKEIIEIDNLAMLDEIDTTGKIIYYNGYRIKVKKKRKKQERR